MDTQTLMNIVQQLAAGLVDSCRIFFLTLLFSMPLGLLVAFGRMSKWSPLQALAPKTLVERIKKANAAEGKTEKLPLGTRFAGGFFFFKPIQFIITVFIAILRGTPLMLQLFAIYYGPYYIFGIPISGGYRFTAVIIAFSINYSAYFAEIYRAGIESIPVGQYEAATVLGYNKRQTFFRIIFPQMCKRILPPVTNEAITLVKDTSLAFVIAFPEMFTIAKQISAAQTTIMPLIIAGVFYFIFNGVVAFVMDLIEKKLNYYR